MVLKLTGVLVALGVLYSSAVGALGLGKLSLDSYLNEPFKAEIELLNVGNLGEDQVRVQLASRADFQRAGVEREYILTSLSFKTLLDQDGGGILSISTSQKVQEPYLNFIVEARWPTGRILQEYTVLLDPPLFTENAPTIVAGVGSGNMRPPEPEQAFSQPVVAERVTPTPNARGGREAIEVGGNEIHRVRPDETLWAIAGRLKSESVSRQQAMLSIHKLNPNAFIGGNINQLKSGSVLRLPLQGQLIEENFAAAVAQVAEHHKRWQQNLSGELAVENKPAPQIDGSADVYDSAEGDEGDQGPMLKIATFDDGQGEGVEALQSEVVANLENLERAQRGNADLQMRLDAMDEQINTLQRLLALKDEQISALTETVQGRADLSSVDELEAELLADIEAESPGKVEPVEAVAALDPARPEPPAIISVPTEEPIAKEPSLMDKLLGNLPYIGALLVLLAAGLGYGFYRYKGQRSAKISEDAANAVDDEFAGVELGDEELIVDHFSDDAGDETGAEERFDKVASSNFQGDSSVGYAAQVETGDVLSEADIYIAYGRFPQAVDLLTEALVADPANIEARLKLMEADVEVRELDAFKQEYANLQAIGDETALLRASSLLESFDGGEKWLEGLPDYNLSEEELAAAKSGPAASGENAGEEAPVDVAPIATESVDEEMLSIDLAIDAVPDEKGGEAEISLLDEPLIDDREALLAAEVETGGEQLSEELDLDDSLLDEIDVSEEELGLELEIEGEELDLNSSDIESDGLEFDVEETLELSDENNIEASVGEAEDAAELGQDFDFEELEIGDVVEDDTAELPLDIDDSDELGDFDFYDMEIADVDSGEEDSELADSLDLPELDLPDVSDVPGFEEGDDESLESALSSDNDEINTKLDLARAYIDMGDAQGARDIIEEVLQEGSEKQLEQANKLLERLD